MGVEGCCETEGDVCDSGVTGDFNGDEATTVEVGESAKPKSVFSMVLFSCNCIIWDALSYNDKIINA